MLFFFFFNDTATTEIYTLSLHDALPIFDGVIRTHVRILTGMISAPQQTHPFVRCELRRVPRRPAAADGSSGSRAVGDRKSTRLNSSHANISYAVFCLKKKKKKKTYCRNQ